MAQPSDTTLPHNSYDEPYRYAREERTAAFEAEDRRRLGQRTDWLILAAMIVISLAYHGIIFLLQPGLR